MANLVLSGDTSGSVTLSAPSVSGSTTLTLPAATGIVMVSGNMPAFSAYQSSAQTLGTNTNTKITFTTSEFDTTGGMYASSRFTPTVAGYYQVTAGLELNTANAGINLTVYKNAALFKRLVNTYNTTTFQASGSCLIYLNGSTDYIEVYGQISVGQALVNTAYSTYFQGCLVRAA